MSLDGSACSALAVGLKEGCILGQIGRLLKNSLATAGNAATADLFSTGDVIDSTAAVPANPTWTSGTSTAACNAATTTWLGVQCAQVGSDFRVVGVDLQSLGLRNYKPLSGTIPTLFAMLTALTYLNLAYNKLQGGLPTLDNPGASATYVATALQGKGKILAVPTTLKEFNVTGNRLAADLATPFESAVINNLVLARTAVSGVAPYQLEKVDLSSNCLAGGSVPDLGAITVGPSGLFRAFNLSGNAGKDGTKPLCGANPTRADCDGKFNNRFACQDNYFVDFGGQASAAGSGSVADSAKETATFKFTGGLSANKKLTLGGLEYSSGAGAVTAAQLATAFSNLPADTAFGTLTAPAVGTFTAGTSPSYTSALATGTTDTVVFTSKQPGNVPDLGATSDEGTPSGATITDTATGVAAVETGLVLKVVNVGTGENGKKASIGGLTYNQYTATAGPTAADFLTAFNGLSAGNKPADTTTGYWTGTLTGWTRKSDNGAALITFQPDAAGTNFPDLVAQGSGAGAVSVSKTSDGAAGTVQSFVLTFPDIPAGAAGRTLVVTGLGLTLTLGSGTVSGTYLAKAFANLKKGMSPTDANTANTLTTAAATADTGSFTAGTAVADWRTSAAGVPGAKQVTFESTKGTAYTTADPTTVTSSDTGVQTLFTGAIANTPRVASTTEVAVVTFNAGINAGDSLILGGLTFTAKTAVTAANLASAFSSLANGAITSAAASNVAQYGSFTGKLSNWKTGATAGNPPTVTFTATYDNIVGPAAEGISSDMGTAAFTKDASSAAGTTAVTPTFVVNFAKGLSKGQTLAIASVTITATAAMTAEEVAAAFSNLNAGSTPTAPAGAKYTVGGTFANTWNTNAAQGASVRFASPAVGATTTLLTATDVVLTGGAPVTITYVQGVGETAVVTFPTSLLAGQSVTVAGLTLTATGGPLTAANIAAGFAGLAAGSSGNAVTNGAWSGTLTGYTSGPVVGTTVQFTSTQTGDVTDLVPSTTQIVAITAAPVVVDGTPTTKETQTFTFAASLPAGKSITIAGLTYTAGGATVTAANLAGAFASLAAGATTGAGAGTGAYTGTLSGWSTGAASGANEVTFTAVANGNVPTLVPTSTDNPAVATVITQGASGNYPLALECGGKKQYVNYFMYEACILNNIRNALDAGVGSPAKQNNTALLTWTGDRACPSQNAVNWTGIECDREDRVIGINLTAKQITGSLPLDFFFLAKLKTLDLSVNRISGSLPTGTFQRWTAANGAPVSTAISMVPTALESLDISDNRLSAAIPPIAGSALAAAVRKRVDLSNNCFRGPLPSSLTSGVPLTISFDLNGNRGKTGTEEEVLCKSDTQASILAACNNKFSNALACSDYVGTVACNNVQWDSYQGYEACLLKRIGTALGADLTALRWVGDAACPPPATPWVGVTCDSQLTPPPASVRDRVVGVDLSNRGLTGTLPFDFYYLSELQTLNLANNRIKGTLQTQQVTINGTNYTAAPFPARIRQVFLQGNAIGGPLSVSIPAYFQLGAQANGSLSVTDFNLTNNCFTGPLASTFDAFIPRVTRVFFNGNLGLCTGVTTAATLAVCDSSNANLFACSGYPSPATSNPVPNFSTQFQALFRFSPSAIQAPGIQKQIIDEIARLMGISADNLRIEGGYIYESTTGQIIARFLSQKIATQEQQSLLVFRVFADNAAAAQAAINNLRANAGQSAFGLIGSSIDTNVIATPVTPTAPRAPTGASPPAGPIAPLAPFAPAKGDGDDDGWKIGVGVGVGVGGFLLCVIIICIVVFCLKKKAAPLPQEIDYNKVAVVQQGAYPVGGYPAGAYPVYPQAAYAVSAPPPTPAYTYAVAA